MVIKATRLFHPVLIRTLLPISPGTRPRQDVTSIQVNVRSGDASGRTRPMEPNIKLPFGILTSQRCLVHLQSETKMPLRCSPLTFIHIIIIIIIIIISIIIILLSPASLPHCPLVRCHCPPLSIRCSGVPSGNGSLRLISQFSLPLLVPLPATLSGYIITKSKDIQNALQTDLDSVRPEAKANLVHY